MQVHVYIYDGDNGQFLRKESADMYAYKPRCKELAQEGYGIKVVDPHDGCVIYTLDPMPR